MDWATILKTYLEVGMLGLSSILLVAIFWLSYKRYEKQDDQNITRKNKRDDDMEKRRNEKEDHMTQRQETKEDRLEEKFDKMIEMMQEQNKELISSIINGVTTHVPSPEENDKLTKVSEEIDHTLQQILLETNASRVSLVQYHNGGKGVNRQSFLKMSITNEQVQLGVKPFITEFKDQFRSVLAYFVKQLSETDFCYIDDVDTIQTVDASMYEFMSHRGIQAKFGMAVRGSEGNVIGFVCAEFLNNKNVDISKLDKCFKENKKVFETLLNL